MTADTPGQNVAQIRKEEAAITKVIERLRPKSPELTEEGVHRAVHGHYDVSREHPFATSCRYSSRTVPATTFTPRAAARRVIDPREIDQRTQHQPSPRSTSHEQPTQDRQSEGRL